MGSGKRRFGVALPSELADELDNVVRNFNISRSAVIEQAVNEFLVEFTHSQEPHTCTGILILFNRGHDLTLTKGFIDAYKDVVLSYTHHHIGTQCIDVLIVHGDSKIIAELQMNALKSKCRCHYIPLEQPVEPVLT